MAKKRENTDNLLKTKNKKKKRFRTTVDADTFKMYGDAPIWNGQSVDDKDYNVKYAAALNWCSRGLDYNAGKEELVHWMSENGYSKNALRAVKTLSDYTVRTDGKLAYLVNNGWPLKQDALDQLAENVKNYISQGNIQLQEQKKEQQVKAKEAAIRADTQKSAASQNACNGYEIADYVEDNVHNNEVDLGRFSAMVKNQKAVVLNIAMNRLQDLHSELALYGKDEDVTFGYQHLTKRQVNKALKVYNEAIKILEGAVLNKKTIRKPRKTKAKSVSQQVKHVKYCENDTTYNVASLSPEQLVGATKAVVFNVKKRKLGIYYSKDDSGFTFKGTTLQNLDEKLSRHKTLRDTKDSKVVDKLHEFRKAPVKRADKLFESLNTTDTILTGRFSNEVIILKVYK